MSSASEEFLLPCWNHSGTTTHVVSSSPSSPIFNYTLTAEDESRSKIIIALAIIRLCLAAFGCVANVVAAVVLTHRKLWSPTSMLLLSLVIYDTFYLLLVIPVGATSISVNVHFTAARYSTLRSIMAFCYPLRSIAQMASTYTTLTVTAERFLVILLPLRANSMWTYGKTRRAIVGVLIFSVLFNLPRCFDHILSKSSVSSTASSAASRTDDNMTTLPGNFSTVPLQEERMPGYSSAHISKNINGTEGTSRTGNFSCLNMRKDDVGLRQAMVSIARQREISETSFQNWTAAPRVERHRGESEGVSEEVVYFYRVIYLFYLTVIFLYLIPYTLIPVLNLQLVIALRRRREESRRISVKNEHRLNGVSTAPCLADKEEGLTYIVFGITFCYFVCCILPTIYIISAIASDSSNYHTAILIFNAGETTLAINAATDFFFYCLLGRKFRHVFMRTFCTRRYVKKANSFTMRTTVSYNSV